MADNDALQIKQVKNMFKIACSTNISEYFNLIWNKVWVKSIYVYMLFVFDSPLSARKNQQHFTAKIRGDCGLKTEWKAQGDELVTPASKILPDARIIH